MITALQLVACAVTISEVFGSVYLYGPHQTPVSIYSPYDYYYVRNLHRINSNVAPLVQAPYVPGSVVQSQLVPTTTFVRAPVAAQAPATISAPIAIQLPTTISAPAAAPIAAPVGAPAPAPIAAPIAAPAPAPIAGPAAPQEGYSFSYEIEAPDGRQARQETADGSGNVRGSYSFSLNDGRQRIVNYVAGADGFKAVVDTNEPGTEQKNPAGVIIANSAPLPQAPAKLPTAGAPVASAQAPKAVQSAPFAPSPYGYTW